MQEESYLSVDTFKKFLVAIPKLHYFKNFDDPFIPQKPPMRAVGYQMLFCVLYYTCIRPIEASRLTKGNVELDRQILYSTNKKGSHKKTTIPLPLVSVLREYLDRYIKDDQVLFKGTLVNWWHYCKMAGKLAGIQYYDEFENRRIEGLYTYVFKYAYTQRLEDLECRPSLISIKLRHSPEGFVSSSTLRYAQRIKALLMFENEHIIENLDDTIVFD